MWHNPRRGKQDCASATVLSTPLDRGLLDSSRELFRFSWCRDLVNGRASKVADVIREPRLCSEAFGVRTGSDRLHPVSEVRPLMLYISFKTMVDVVVQNACPPTYRPNDKGLAGDQMSEPILDSVRIWIRALKPFTR